MTIEKASILLNDLLDSVPLTEMERQKGRVYISYLEQSAKKANELNEKLEQAKKEHNDKIEELRQKIDVR